MDDNSFDMSSVFDFDAAASLQCIDHEMPVSVSTIDVQAYGDEWFEGHAGRRRESSAPLHSPKDSGSGKPAPPDTEAENPKKSTADASLLADESTGHTLPEDAPLEPQLSKHRMAASKPEGDGPENLELQDPRMGPQRSCNGVQGAATLISKNYHVTSALALEDLKGLDNTPRGNGISEIGNNVTVAIDSGVAAHGNIAPACGSPIRIDSALGASNTAEIASADKAATRDMFTCNGDSLEAATQDNVDVHDCIVIPSASISGNTEAADNEVATKDSLGDTAGAGPEDANMIHNETAIGNDSELSSAKDTTTPSPKTVAQSLKRKRKVGQRRTTSENVHRRSKRPRTPANYTRYTDIEIMNIHRKLKRDSQELVTHIDKTWEASEEELERWMQSIKEEFYKRAEELKDRQKAFATTLNLMGFQ